MNVLVIDDHFSTREGISHLLSRLFHGIEVQEAGSVEEGLVLARRVSLNLVLLDIQLPGKGGLQGLAELRQEFPCLCVVMFSGSDDRELVFEALRRGAMGFIPKTVPRQDFVEALRDVLAGRVYLPRSAIDSAGGSADPVRSADDPRRISDPAGLDLTAREFEVLRWLVQGKTNKEIARRLGIGEQTVKNHLRPVFQKFGVARRAELMVRVAQQGIVLGTPEVGN